MRTPHLGLRVTAALLLGTLTACAQEPAVEVAAVDSTPSDEASSTPATTTSTTEPATAPPATRSAPSRAAQLRTDGRLTRTLQRQLSAIAFEAAHPVFATTRNGTIELRLPNDRVELVGFHQSNHDGAQQLEPVGTLGLTMEDRHRDTASRGAADVAVPPDTPIHSPVTGTVLRAGTYVLYCDHSDDFVVVQPDGLPGWEVKLLHIDGVRVSVGDRVVAGRTLLAPRATILPFESQVNEHTASPTTPHVHIEVVDTSIPDRPSPGGGC